MALFIGRYRQINNSNLSLTTYYYLNFRLSLDTHPRDLEHIFDKYGRLNRLEVKRGYAFVEYQDERDASDAMKETDGLVCMLKYERSKK
jgi:RNA recognition motif-containing protein